MRISCFLLPFLFPFNVLQATEPHDYKVFFPKPFIQKSIWEKKEEKKYLKSQLQHFFPTKEHFKFLIIHLYRHAGILLQHLKKKAQHCEKKDKKKNCSFSNIPTFIKSKISDQYLPIQWFEQNLFYLNQRHAAYFHHNPPGFITYEKKSHECYVFFRGTNNPHEFWDNLPIWKKHHIKNLNHLQKLMKSPPFYQSDKISLHSSFAHTFDLFYPAIEQQIYSMLDKQIASTENAQQAFKKIHQLKWTFIGYSRGGPIALLLDYYLPSMMIKYFNSRKKKLPFSDQQVRQMLESPGWKRKLITIAAPGLFFRSMQFDQKYLNHCFQHCLHIYDPKDIVPLYSKKIGYLTNPGIGFLLSPCVTEKLTFFQRFFHHHFAGKHKITLPEWVWHD